MSAIKDAIARWYSVGEQYAEFGACDTEPRAEFALLLERLLDGRDPGVPQGPSAWDLFDDMPGVGAAALALTEAAQQVVDTAAAHPGLPEAYAYYFGRI